jgi:hypothetical protein
MQQSYFSITREETAQMWISQILSACELTRCVTRHNDVRQQTGQQYVSGATAINRPCCCKKTGRFYQKGSMYLLDNLG